jgi:hypothetical protein
MRPRAANHRARPADTRATERLSRLRAQSGLDLFNSAALGPSSQVLVRSSLLPARLRITRRPAASRASATKGAGLNFRTPERHPAVVQLIEDEVPGASNFRLSRVAQ